MTAGTTFPSLDIVPYWGRLNDGLATLIDYLPDDKLDWSPHEGLWSLRGIVLHIALARHNWMGSTVQDGLDGPNRTSAEAVQQLLVEGQTKDGMRKHLALSWERVQRFLSDPTKLAKAYTEIDPDGTKRTLDGHWIAFHLLEHDVHHRADIFHYLALLGVEHPEVGTP